MLFCPSSVLSLVGPESIAAIQHTMNTTDEVRKKKKKKQNLKPKKEEKKSEIGKKSCLSSVK